jgi:hypothetical protein
VKRYTASEARRRISKVLDGAEHGEKVVIERASNPGTGHLLLATADVE